MHMPCALLARFLPLRKTCRIKCHISCGSPACRKQVEERLKFYEEGIAPRKNATVMAEAMEKFKAGLGDGEDGDDAAMDEGGDGEAAGTPGEKEKKAKKRDKEKKKKKKDRVAVRSLASRCMQLARFAVSPMPCHASIAQSSSRSRG
jgi:hypothetical protein